MSKVALIRCESYEYDTVKSSIERGLSLLGGISLFVQKGENILLKPNLLMGEATALYYGWHLWHGRERTTSFKPGFFPGFMNNRFVSKPHNN